MIEWGRLTPRKRKELETSSSGIFTRNRSQSLLHRTRSGRVRLDRTPNPSQPISSSFSSTPVKSPKIPRSVINVDVDERVAIKDLRLRRVFSPNSIGREVDVDKVRVKRVKSDLGFSQEVQKKSEDAEIQKSSFEGLGFLREDEKKIGDTESKKSAFEDVGFSQEDEKKIGDGEIEAEIEKSSIDDVGLSQEVAKRIGNTDDAIETEIQKSAIDDVGLSPKIVKKSGDTEIETEIQKSVFDGVGFSQVDEKKSGGAEIVEILKSSCDDDQLIQSTPTQATIDEVPVLNNPSNERALVVKGKTPISKVVLTPYARTKLFKTPCSFSYRRLLPFLMDMEREDNHNALELRPCQNIEKPSQETPYPLSVNHDVPKDVLEEEILATKNPLERSDASTIQESRKAIRCDGLSNADCSNLEADKWQLTHFDIQKPQASIVSIGRRVDDTKVEIDACFSQEEQNKSGHADIEKASCDGDDWIQSTPPDIATDGIHVRKSPSNERGFSENEKNPNSKAFLVPFTRTKLYKNPSSFSYRRMLPFLRDLKKEDNCNAALIRPCQKVEKSVKEERFPLLLVNHDVSKDEPQDTFLTMKHHLEGSDASPTQESSETIVNGSSCVDSPNLESTKHRLVKSDDIQNPSEDFVIPTIICPEQPLFESKIQKSPEASIATTVNGLSERSNKLEPACDDIHVRGTDSPVNSSSLVAIDENVSIRKSIFGGSSVFPNEVKVDSTIPIPNCMRDVKPHGALALCQIQSEIEVLSPVEKLVSDPLKGILKRYPRGCRGPCNCLNCASFNLHAERAFEFSRNQMQDTEDLSLGLMKELSDLRSLLEKSVEGAECHAVIQVSKVKEACSKALVAEELAKRRISEMNNELSIHCRTPCLQRPRVRFTHNAESSGPVTENFLADSTKNERM